MYHKKCMGTIVADISSAYKIIANYMSINSRTGKLTVNRVNIKKVSKSLGRKKFSFMCEDCGKEIKNMREDGLMSCMDCGEIFELTDLYVPIDSGGIYCKKCSKSFRSSIDDVTKLLDILDESVIVL